MKATVIIKKSKVELQCYLLIEIILTYVQGQFMALESTLTLH